LYASTACRNVSGCIGSCSQALPGCTLPQRAGTCPAVSVHALRLCPVVRFHSVPDYVRLYRLTPSGSLRLYALTACRIMSGCISSCCPVLSGCTLPQRAGTCPAVSAHAVRFSPAVRFHSVPDHVRLYQLMLSGSLRLYAPTVCRNVSGCIGSRCPVLSGCTLSQRAGTCPAVSVHALRLCPAVRFHSVPECVRLYRLTLSGSALLYALTACRLQCSGDLRRGRAGLGSGQLVNPRLQGQV
jgi:hypothetical protein